jgi:hypothetical protein
VAEGIEQGELRPGDPDLLSLASGSLVHGLSHLLINRASSRREAARRSTS